MRRYDHLLPNLLRVSVAITIARWFSSCVIYVIKVFGYVRSGLLHPQFLLSNLDSMVLVLAFTSTDY